MRPVFNATNPMNPMKPSGAMTSASNALPMLRPRKISANATQATAAMTATAVGRESPASTAIRRRRAVCPEKKKSKHVAAQAVKTASDMGRFNTIAAGGTTAHAMTR